MSALVLVADDSAVVRLAVSAALLSEGYRVSEAEDGAAALASCRAEPPDVILLDVEMPVLDGFQTLQALKSDPRLVDIPVIFLTGRSDWSDVVAALGEGAHDYLRKPFETPELMARVAAAARMKWLQDELRARNDELGRLARVDQLTGLSNRRHVEEEMNIAVARASRSGCRLGVLLIDVDHFKRVNDTYGHESGDVVLKEVAHRIRAGARDGDIVGRWGGEEFLILLPEADVAATEAAAQRVRMAIAARSISLADGTEVGVTASIGVAVGTAAEAPRLVGLSDEALYEAKNGGRNMVCLRAVPSSLSFAS